MQIDMNHYRELSRRVRENPAYLEELKVWQINDLMEYVLRLRTGVEERRDKLRHVDTGEPLRLDNFADWREAEHLEALIKAEAERREQNEKAAAEANRQPTQAKPEPAVPRYEFDALFVEGAKDRFLRAAQKAGMIDSTGNWALGERKKWVIVAAWNLAANSDLTAPGLNDFGACKAIAEHWGVTISQTMFDDCWSARRNDHNSKRGYDSYSRFLQEFTRG